MKKYIWFVFFLSVLFLFSSAVILNASDEHGKMQMSSSSEKKVSKKELLVVNKTCPITGEPINGKTFAVYKGKRYGFCCEGCDEAFMKDPDKYIKVLKKRGDLSE